MAYSDSFCAVISVRLTKAELRAVTLRHGTALRIHPGNIFPEFPDSMDAAEECLAENRAMTASRTMRNHRMHMDEQRIKILTFPCHPSISLRKMPLTVTSEAEPVMARRTRRRRGIPSITA